MVSLRNMLIKVINAFEVLHIKLRFLLCHVSKIRRICFHTGNCLMFKWWVFESGVNNTNELQNYLKIHLKLHIKGIKNEATELTRNKLDMNRHVCYNLHCRIGFDLSSTLVSRRRADFTSIYASRYCSSLAYITSQSALLVRD